MEDAGGKVLAFGESALPSMLVKTRHAKASHFAFAKQTRELRTDIRKHTDFTLQGRAAWVMVEKVGC